MHNTHTQRTPLAAAQNNIYINMKCARVANVTPTLTRTAAAAILLNVFAIMYERVFMRELHD